MRAMRGLRKAASVGAIVSALGLGVATDLLAQGKPRIAVMNFANNSTWTWWGDNLGAAAADELVTQLVKTGKFSVIERAQLEAILQEQRLGQSGLTNPATAAKVGQLLGAQLIMTGSITQFSIERTQLGIRGIGGAYSKAESKLDVRLVDTTTGEVLIATDGTGSKRMGGGYFKGVSGERTFDAGAAAEALRPAVEHVVQQVSSQSFKVAEVVPPVAPGRIVGSREGSFYINKGEAAGIKVGQRFAVKHVVDEIKDADGKVLDVVMQDTGVLEVTQVLSQSSIAKVVEGTASQGDAVEAR
ncbi:MAG: CsgG/HfaB family protein [Vicinamibacterales bacterium]